MSLVPTQVMVSVDPSVVTLGTLLRKTLSVSEGDGQETEYESNLHVIAASACMNYELQN